jgi:hypothetical protein
MKRHVFVIVVVAVVLVLSLVLFLRSKETYVLPDVTASGPDICPLGFVLTCVSKDLPGINDTVPFPESLPKPCEDTHNPLCLPSPEHTKPAYAKK